MNSRFKEFYSLCRQDFACTFCPEQIANTYLFHFYRIYILRFPIGTLFNVGCILEILLSCERYCSLRDKEISISKIPVKFIIIGGSLFFAILFIPDYMAIEIKYSGSGDIYLFSLTAVGQSKWYPYYYVAYYGIFYIFVIGSLTSLNILTVRALHLLILRRGRQKGVYGITRMIIFTNTYYILVRILHVISLGIFQIEKNYGIYYSPSTNLLREFAYLILIFSYVANIFVYVYFDKDIRNKIKEHFETNK